MTKALNVEDLLDAVEFGVARQDNGLENLSGGHGEGIRIGNRVPRLDMRGRQGGFPGGGQDILDRASEWRLPPEAVEKDYVLG